MPAGEPRREIRLSTRQERNLSVTNPVKTIQRLVHALQTYPTEWACGVKQAINGINDLITYLYLQRVELSSHIPLFFI